MLRLAAVAIVGGALLLRGVVAVRSPNVPIRNMHSFKSQAGSGITPPPQCDRGDSKEHHRYDPLACWLWKLEAAIPRQKFKKSIFSVTIEDMVCTNFTIGDVQATYIPSNVTDPTRNGAGVDPAISTSVQGISAACKGRYKSTGMSGNVLATVESPQPNGDNRALGLTVTFVSKLYQNRTRMADAARTDFCLAQLHVPEHGGLKFTGSLSAKLINMFSSSIAKYVSDALSTQLCPALQTELDRDLTSVLQTIDRYLMTRILPNATETVKVKSSRRHLLERKDRFVDWKRDAPLLHSSLQLLNRFLDRYLNQGFFMDLMGSIGLEKDIQGDCGYFFRGVNGVFRSLTYGTGRVTFRIPNSLPHLKNITFELPKYAMISVLVDEVSIDGVDELTQLNLLRPMSDDGQTFGASLASTVGFNVTVAMQVVVESIEGGIFQGDPLIETFSIELNSSRVGLDGSASLGYDKEGFSVIAMGDVMTLVDSALDRNLTDAACLLSPLKKVQLPKLSADVNVLGAVFLPDGNGNAGQLEKDLDRMLNTFLELFLGEYDVLVTDSISGLLDGPVREFLNKFLESNLGDAPLKLSSDDASACRDWSEIAGIPDLFDFAKHSMFRKLNQFLNQEATLTAINDYATCVMEIFNLEVGSKSHSMSTEGIEIKLQKLVLENFGVLDRLELLSPEHDGFHVRNSVSFGACDDGNFTIGDEVCTDAPKVSARLGGSVPTLNFTSHFNASVELHDLAVTTNTLVHYDMNKLRSVKLSRILSNIGCSVLPLDIVSTQETVSNFLGLHLALSALLTSPVFENSRFVLDSDKLPTISKASQSVVEWLFAIASDSWNGLWLSVLPHSKSVCYDIEVPTASREDNENSVPLMFLLVAGAVILIAHVAFLFVRLNAETKDQFIEELPSPLIPYTVLHDDVEKTLVDHPVSQAKTINSLLGDRSIPRGIRHGFPVMVAATTALLVSSNLSVGASVNVVLTFDQFQAISLPSFFSFSLANTAREMYNAGVYPLLAIVVVFSGIWPYAKLLLMLYAWITPSDELEARLRGRLLFLLDALSKFSLVDTFVLVLMIVSFRFHLDIGALPILDVYVDPSFGFYGFLLATLLSLLAGHAALFYHRQSQVKVDTKSNERESLSQHAYSDDGTERKWRVSCAFQSLIAILLGIAFFFLVVGASRKSFTFEFSGLAGTMLGADRRKSYSLLTLGLAIPSSVQDPSAVGIVFLQMAYYFYALIMPLLCLVTLTVLFWAPLTLRHQRRALAVAEICNAWSAVEVFALSIVAALLQISTFASFLIGNKCDLINALLKDHFDEAMGGDDVCYMVKASVAENVWYLVCGVFLNSFVVSLLLRIAHHALEERYEGELTHEQGESSSFKEESNEKRHLIEMLLRSATLRWLLFTDAEEGPLSPCNSRFWEEWRRVVSFT